MSTKSKRKDSEIEATAQSITFVRTSSKDAYEAAKASGRPIMEVIAGERSSDGFHAFGGMAFRGDTGTPVTGKIPVSWADFLDSQKAKVGRPRKKIEIKVAMFLSAQNFRAQGHGIKQSRVLAAQRIVPGTDPGAAERKYRIAEKDLLKSGALNDFNTHHFFVKHDECVMMAHRSAVIDVQTDRVHLSGSFWLLVIGDTSARLVENIDITFIPL